MRIVFVRHGHPNYEDDCLTELGRLQAAAAAERLKDEGIGGIYASTCGRAYETAEYTAKKLGLPIHECPFMREISWGSVDDVPLEEDGHPWYAAWARASRGEDQRHTDWENHGQFPRNKVVDCVRIVTEGFDEWMKFLGYTREGLYYRAGENTGGTVAMFSHGGASSAALAHLLNIPFPLFCGSFEIDFTSVTVVELSDEPGKLVMPFVRLMNDARHIRGITVENIYGK